MLGSMGRRWTSLWVLSCVLFALLACSCDDAPAKVPRDLQGISSDTVEVGYAVTLHSSVGADARGLGFEWDFGDGAFSTVKLPQGATW